MRAETRETAEEKIRQLRAERTRPRNQGSLQEEQETW